jgi:hypothetical protein
VYGLVSAAIAATVLVACSSSGSATAPPVTVTTTTTPPPTTTTTTKAQAAAAKARAAAAQLTSDKAKIMAMWRANNDAWNTSRSAGILSDIANTWPPSRAAGSMTFAQCDQYMNSGLWDNVVVDPSTIKPQPRWVYSVTNSVPDGRAYIMTTQLSERYGAAVQPTQSQELHALVAPDGHAYKFETCHD